MKSQKELIRKIANQLGFDKVGVCKPVTPVHFESYLRWIENGYYGSMNYLARRMDQRMDPGRLLPGAKSIVLCLVNYFCPELDKENNLGIARFARGQDYHKHMPKALKALAKKIEELIDKPLGHYIFCDTSAVIERSFATMAGLGWIGKNNCLISDIGSWTFIGGIILDLELEPDHPVPDRCGSCELCLDACPTGALLSPYLLDARRCLSYLTIEHKGAIEEQFKKLMKPGQYGCDICQEVCPYNQRPPVTKWGVFKSTAR